jgi:hypothetical protein
MPSSVLFDLLVIFGLHRELQGRSSVGSERADCGWRDPEDRSRFLARVIKEIQEHECGALALR